MTYFWRLFCNFPSFFQHYYLFLTIKNMSSLIAQQPATQISAVMTNGTDDNETVTSKLTPTTFTKTGSSGSAGNKCKLMVADMKTYMTMYVTKELYPKIKFPPIDDQRLNCIDDCMAKHRVKPPDGVSTDYFKRYFYDKFSTVFSTLRHNGQTLARRRYLGKYTKSSSQNSSTPSSLIALIFLTPKILRIYRQHESPGGSPG